MTDPLAIKLPEPLTGKALSSAINSPLPRRPAIAEGLLHELSCLMITSDPGLGKSTLSLQAALSFTSQTPLFGFIPVSRPYRVYYIQKERPSVEILERIEAMQANLPWNPDLFFLDYELQTFNLANPKYHNFIVDRIASYSPEIVFIDPIYAGQAGLSKDEVASEFCAFLTKLQHRTKATLWLNHHTTKPGMGAMGERLERDDPFYGSQWLKAHITGSYYVTQTEEGTKWTRKKDSHGNLLKEFVLEYDPETYLSCGKGGLSLREKILLFCEGCKARKQRFTIKEMLKNVGGDMRSIRRLLVTPPFDTLLIRHKSLGGSTLYEVKW